VKKRSDSAPSRPADLATIDMPAVTPVILPRHLQAALRNIMVRDLGVKFAEGAVLFALVLPALWLVQALVDWSFNLPWLARLILLGVDAGLALFFGFRFFVQPWRHRLTFETGALRAEEAVPAFRSGLISAVELAAGRRGSMQGALPLVRELVERVSRQVQGVNLPQLVIKTGRLRRRSVWAALVLVLAAGAAVFSWPESEILLQRIFLSRLPLPTRTTVIAVTQNESVTVGADLTLSARARGVIPKSGRLHVVYANNDGQELSASATLDDPVTFVLPMKNVQQSFHYQFILNDGTGQEFNVTVKTPPSLASFECVQTYPAYTRLAEARMAIGNLALFAGSRLQIEGRSTQPLGTATLHLEGINQQVPMELDRDSRQTFQGQFTVPRKGLTGLSVHLVNSKGVSSVDDTVYQVELVQDKPPVVSLTVPLAKHLDVLLRGKPRLVYSVSDDFGLRNVVLKYELSIAAPPGGLAPPSISGEISLPVPKQDEPATPQIYNWNIATQSPPWSEGCTVTYWIEATDNNTVTGPGITQSSKKTLSVVSEAAKRAEIRDALGLRGTELEQLYDAQKSINQDLDNTLRKTPP
jgi:hypothetical protein